MQRRSFMKKAAAGAAVATIAAPAIAQAPQIRWRLSSSFPKSLDTLYGAAELFVKKVSEATGGRFQISLHAGGEITPPFAVVDAIQQGTIECAHTAPYYFFGKDPTFAMDCAIPFGMNARAVDRLDVRRQRHGADRASFTSRTTSSTSRWAIPARKWAAGTGRKSRLSTTSKV